MNNYRELIGFIEAIHKINDCIICACNKLIILVKINIINDFYKIEKYVIN